MHTDIRKVQFGWFVISYYTGVWLQLVYTSNIFRKYIDGYKYLNYRYYIDKV